MKRLNLEEGLFWTEVYKSPMSTPNFWRAGVVFSGPKFWSPPQEVLCVGKWGWGGDWDGIQGSPEYPVVYDFDKQIPHTGSNLAS